MGFSLRYAFAILPADSPGQPGGTTLAAQSISRNGKEHTCVNDDW